MADLKRSANTMTTDLKSSLRPQKGGLPPHFAKQFAEIWATKLKSGGYSIPIKFLPAADLSLGYLVNFAGPIFHNFAERYNAMIHEAAPELSGWHNRYARGRFKMEDADEIIPHLVPDCIYFAHRTLFGIEFSPYKPLAHLGMRLGFGVSSDWFMKVTSWDKDLPPFHPTKKGPNQIITAQRASRVAD